MQLVAECGGCSKSSLDAYYRMSCEAGHAAFDLNDECNEPGELEAAEECVEAYEEHISGIVDENDLKVVLDRIHEMAVEESSKNEDENTDTPVLPDPADPELKLPDGENLRSLTTSGDAQVAPEKPAESWKGLPRSLREVLCLRFSQHICLWLVYYEYDVIWYEVIWLHGQFLRSFSQSL